MPTLYALDHGGLELDRRLHYPSRGRSDRTPDAVREAVATFSAVCDGAGGTTYGHNPETGADSPAVAGMEA